MTPRGVEESKSGHTDETVKKTVKKVAKSKSPEAALSKLAAGKTAALSVKSTGPQRLLCTFVVEAKDADAWADEPIWYNGDVVGFVTSGGYAHFAQKSVAMGFVPTPLVCPKLNVEIEIVGERCPASLIAKPLFDRESKRLRG